MTPHTNHPAWPVPNKVQLVLGGVPPVPAAAAQLWLFYKEQLLLPVVEGEGYKLAGGQREWHETPEETCSRLVYENFALQPLLAGSLGYIHVSLQGEKPHTYPYPFPKAVIEVFWAIANPDAPKPAESVAFPPDKAPKMPLVHPYLPFYEQALARAQLVLSTLTTPG